MQDLKLGLIGVGGRGIIATHAHLPGQGSRIVACADLSVTALEQGRETYGNDIFTTIDYEDLLAQDLDGVFITTPDFLHEKMAIAALQARIPVFLEKPMAITIEGCDSILNTAREYQTKLYVGHNMRHMPFVFKMKQIIDSGAIGAVKTIWCRHFVGHGGDFYFKRWHAESKYSTGMLLQKGVHDIDIIHWLSGGYSELVQGLGALTIYGDITDRAEPMDGPRLRAAGPRDGTIWPPRNQSGFNHDVDIEDLSLVQMRLDNGVFASYQQCHYTPDYWRSYTIIGDEGRLENFGNGEDGTCIKVWNKRKEGYAAPDAVHMVEPGLAWHGGADLKVIAEFLHFVRTGSETRTSPLAARNSVAAGCSATASLRNGGQVVQVPPVSASIASHFGTNARG